jgi:hypothetical protein
MYGRTEQFLLTRTDAVIAMQTQVFLSAPPHRQLEMLDRLPRHDPLNVEYAGLFTAQGKLESKRQWCACLWRFGAGAGVCALLAHGTSFPATKHETAPVLRSVLYGPPRFQPILSVL